MRDADGRFVWDEAEARAEQNRDYREWLAKEPERQAARAAAEQRAERERAHRERVLRLLEQEAHSAEECMEMLQRRYDEEYEFDNHEEFMDAFRAILQAWKNGQKAE